MEVHCIDFFKNLTEINDKTSYYLVAPRYFNNIRKIIIKTIFFLSVFFKSSKFSFVSFMQKSSCLPKPTFHVQLLKPYAHVCTINNIWLIYFFVLFIFLSTTHLSLTSIMCDCSYKFLWIGIKSLLDRLRMSVYCLCFSNKEEDAIKISQ